jgi:mono/diheme cytochrome c family protein
MNAKALFVFLGVALVTVAGVRAQSTWTIPDDAPGLTSPLTVDASVLKRGASIFNSRCRKCHGPEGKGDGPYSDLDQPAADLTMAEVGRIPDGVLFYKIWNGKKPMPAFKTDLEKKDVWSVVAFVKTLSAVKTR